MAARLGVAAIIIALAVCALWSAEHWNEPPELVIDGARATPAAALVLTPPPGDTPIAIPDPNALFAPCPMTPRNILQPQKRDA